MSCADFPSLTAPLTLAVKTSRLYVMFFKVAKICLAHLFETSVVPSLLEKLFADGRTGETDEPPDDSFSVGDFSDMESEWDPCETAGL